MNIVYDTYINFLSELMPKVQNFYASFSKCSICNCNYNCSYCSEYYYLNSDLNESVLYYIKNILCNIPKKDDKILDNFRKQITNSHFCNDEKFIFNSMEKLIYFLFFKSLAFYNYLSENYVMYTIFLYLKIFKNVKSKRKIKIMISDLERIKLINRKKKLYKLYIETLIKYKLTYNGMIKDLWLEIINITDLIENKEDILFMFNKYMSYDLVDISNYDKFKIFLNNEISNKLIPIKYYVLFVLFSDNYLKCKENISIKKQSFFKIISMLPIELQMLISYRITHSNKYIINNKHFDFVLTLIY